MDKLVWNDNYSVGSHILDTQHKRLLDLVNKMGDLVDRTDSNSEKEFEEILHDLSLYAVQHFKTEESLLKKYNYIEIHTQEEDHYVYQDTLIEHLTNTEFGKVNKKELHKFLSNWWNEHILINDMKFKPFISQFWSNKE